MIRLAGRPAANFDNPAAVRPLWVARLFKQNAAGAVAGTPPVHPLAAPANYAVNTASLFNVELRNIDFDCGGHAGAVGVTLPAAQGAFCVDVKINAAGAYAGFYGLPGRHAGAINVQVDYSYTDQTTTGSAPRRRRLRAVGPGLAAFGVPEVLADPQIDLGSPGGLAPLASNDD